MCQMMFYSTPQFDCSAVPHPQCVECNINTTLFHLNFGFYSVGLFWRLFLFFGMNVFLLPAFVFPAFF